MENRDSLPLVSHLHVHTRAVREAKVAETKAAVEFAEAHRALYYELFDRIQASITSAAANGRTVREPSTAAMYAVNALLAYPEGNDLLRRIVAHLDDGETTRTGRGQS